MRPFAYDGGMGERLQRLPGWARKVLLIASIVGPVAGATSTVIVTYMDVRAKAREANRKTEAGYETLAPAVKELQELMELSQNWGEDVDKEVEALWVEKHQLERRIVRLETYIEMLGARRNLPEPPEPAGDEDGATELMVETDAPEKRDTRPKLKKPSRPVPTDVQKAQVYQQQRIEMRCPEGDPLCGALE
jgi:hypothetical protein